MTPFLNRRHRAMSPAGRTQPARTRRPFRPRPEALELRALLSLDLDPRLLDVNKAGIGSDPASITVVGATTFFLANDRSHGQELYATDGSVEGTRLVKDINSGPASANIHGMTALNGVLMFFADDGKNGEALWRSNGKEQGTFLVKDINPGQGNAGSAVSSALNTAAVFQGKLFFAADDGTHGTELWKTDGSSAGTSLVSDINTGPAGSNPAALTVFKNELFFQATAGTGGAQLFASDGTTSGTGLFKTLNPNGGASPFDFTPFGGALYFAASDGTNGTQLWKTSGTPAGTAEVTVIPGNPNVRDLTSAGGKLFFAADSGLWKTDGTVTGTSLVSAVGSPSYLTPLNGKVVFSATTPGHGKQLWISDGTTAGTAAVTDINANAVGFDPTATRGKSESQFATLGGNVYFTATDGNIHGRQLWRSDGTVTGTTRVTDINPIGFGTNLNNHNAIQYLGSNPDGVTAVNGRLFFSANDGPDGAQLWTSLGKASNTRMLTQIVNGTKPSNPIEGFVPGPGFTFFQADDGIHGNELWRTDGTTSGTFMIKDVNPGPRDSAPHYLTAFDGKLLFMAIDPAHGQELWISDGTTAGTFMLADIKPGALSSYARNFTEVNGVMYFQANDGTHGIELWRTDGTANGTFLVKDIDPQTHGRNKIPNDSYPSFLTAFNGKLYFQANDVEHGSQLWVSDGTSDGTTLVTGIDPGAGSLYPSSLKVFNGHLFFGANDGSGGSGLWESDGTTAGTFLLADINPNIPYDFPQTFTAVGNRLYFTADDGVNGRQLWATDGTAAGTRMAKLINPQGDAFHNGPLFTMMAAVDGTLLFAADDGVHGTELWRSDGTTEGTSLVKDINPGAGDGITFTYFQDFAVVGGNLYFAASDGTHGSQLWTSNGTKHGTTRVAALSFPYFNPVQAIANVNGSLFFQADDGIHGFELWTIPANQLTGGHDHHGGDHHDHDGRDDHGHGLPSDHDDSHGYDAAPSVAIAPVAVTANDRVTSPRPAAATASPALPRGPLRKRGIMLVR